MENEMGTTVNDLELFDSMLEMLADVVRGCESVEEAAEKILSYRRKQK